MASSRSSAGTGRRYHTPWAHPKKLRESTDEDVTTESLIHPRGEMQACAASLQPSRVYLSVRQPCHFVLQHRELTLLTSSLLLRPLGSTYSGRVLFLHVLRRGVVALCNNLVTPCDNEVEHRRGPTPDGRRRPGGGSARVARALGVYLRASCRGAERLSPPVKSSSSSSADDVPTKGPALLAVERKPTKPPDMIRGGEPRTAGL